MHWQDGCLYNLRAMKLKAVAVIIAPVIAVGTPFLLPKLTSVRSTLLDTRPAAAIEAASGKADADEPALDDSLNIDVAELQTAVEQGIVKGSFLGNGRDRGLLGITFKLSGQTDQPKLTINPLSLIAPGVFRQIFEFQ